MMRVDRGCKGGGVYALYCNNYYNYNNIVLLIHSIDIRSEEDERILAMIGPSYGTEDDST